MKETNRLIDEAYELISSFKEEKSVNKEAVLIANLHMKLRKIDRCIENDDNTILKIMGGEGNKFKSTKFYIDNIKNKLINGKEIYDNIVGIILESYEKR